MDIHSIESNVKFPDISFYNMEKPGEMVHCIQAEFGCIHSIPFY